MTERAFIRPRTEGSPEKGLLPARGLPPDVLQDASRRLAITGGLLAFAFFIALVVTNVVRAQGLYAYSRPQARSLIALTMIVVSLGMALLARRGGLEPSRLLDIGLTYEVVIAFGISMGDNLSPLTTDRPWRRSPGSACGSPSTR